MTAKLDGTNGLIQQYAYLAPATGFSYTFPAGTNVLVMNPAGTLATGTITMPASPADGMTITFSSTKAITALTVSANTGQSITGNPSSFGANSAISFVYRLSNTTWYPITGLSTGTLTNATLTNPTMTTPNIDSAQVPTVSGTAPLYMCRAWVSFDGATAGTFAGGVSTVARTAGSSTATVTTTTAHGLITGNTVYAATGVVAGFYVVTYISATQFSFTTAATTALSTTITFTTRAINASGNVSSVATSGTGNYAINFSVAMPDDNYAGNVTMANAGGVPAPYVPSTTLPTAGTFTVYTVRSDTGAGVSPTYVAVTIFR